MEIALVSLICGVFISGVLNVVLFILLKKSAKRPAITRGATELLHDLTAGGEAMVKITVIDPSGLLMWRGQ